MQREESVEERRAMNNEGLWSPVQYNKVNDQTSSVVFHDDITAMFEYS